MWRTVERKGEGGSTWKWDLGCWGPCLLREQRFVFCPCLFANFLASHVCLALRLYNAPINWVSQAARQPGKPGKAATEARACFKCLINAPLCCQLTQLIHINAPNHQPQAACCCTVQNCGKLSSWLAAYMRRADIDSQATRREAAQALIGIITHWGGSGCSWREGATWAADERHKGEWESITNEYFYRKVTIN